MAIHSKQMGGAVLLLVLLLAVVAFALPTKSDTDFTDNRDGTVTDKTTGLMWQQQDDGTARRTWDLQLQYCAGLSLGGYADWRLPNIKELTSIVDPSRANPATYSVFRGAHDAYASSTHKVTGSNNFWCVAASSGEVGDIVVGGGTYLCSVGGYLMSRCVRGGR